MNKLLLAAPLLLLAHAARAAAPAIGSPDSPVIVKVNGVPVERTQVDQRLWAQYGNTVFNQMIDEILVRQEAAARKVKADTAEVDARLKRIQSQFPDEATFKKQLQANGTSLQALRAPIEEQVIRETLLIKAKKLAVSDAEVKDLFERNKSRLGTGEALKLRHILVSTEKQANDFLVAVRAGADFAKLASQVSMDNATKDKGGDLGFVSRGMLQPEIEKPVFALKPGEAAVVQTAAGFHIFKVEESRAGKPATFDEVKGDLKNALMADKISKAWPEYIQTLREKAKFDPSLRAP